MHVEGSDVVFQIFAALGAGDGDDVLALREHPRQRELSRRERFDALVKKYDWSDPGKYVAHAAPAFVFLQFATQERFLKPELARQSAAIVSEPKSFKLYDAPHALNAEARRDRIAFLTEQLKLKALPASVIANIPDLYQPPNEDKL